MTHRVNINRWTNGRMDRRTNRWKLAHLSRPAKADATKKQNFSPKE